MILPEGNGNQLSQLQTLMGDEGAVAQVGFFWHGEAGQRPPVIPGFARAVFDRLSAEIETDFDTD